MSRDKKWITNLDPDNKVGIKAAEVKEDASDAAAVTGPANKSSSKGTNYERNWKNLFTNGDTFSEKDDPPPPYSSRKSKRRIRGRAAQKKKFFICLFIAIIIVIGTVVSVAGWIFFNKGGKPSQHSRFAVQNSTDYIAPSSSGSFSDEGPSDEENAIPSASVCAPKMEPGVKQEVNVHINITKQGVDEDADVTHESDKGKRTISINYRPNGGNKKTSRSKFKEGKSLLPVKGTKHRKHVKRKATVPQLPISKGRRPSGNPAHHERTSRKTLSPDEQDELNCVKDVKGWDKMRVLPWTAQFPPPKDEGEDGIVTFRKCQTFRRQRVPDHIDVMSIMRLDKPRIERETKLLTSESAILGEGLGHLVKELGMNSAAVLIEEYTTHSFRYVHRETVHRIGGKLVKLQPFLSNLAPVHKEEIFNCWKLNFEEPLKITHLKNDSLELWDVKQLSSADREIFFAFAKCKCYRYHDLRNVTHFVFKGELFLGDLIVHQYGRDPTLADSAWEESIYENPTHFDTGITLGRPSEKRCLGQGTFFQGLCYCFDGFQGSDCKRPIDAVSLEFNFPKYLRQEIDVKRETPLGPSDDPLYWLPNFFVRRALPYGTKDFPSSTLLNFVAQAHNGRALKYFPVMECKVKFFFRGVPIVLKALRYGPRHVLNDDPERKVMKLGRVPNYLIAVGPPGETKSVERLSKYLDGEEVSRFPTWNMEEPVGHQTVKIPIDHDKVSFWNIVDNAIYYLDEGIDTTEYEMAQVRIKAHVDAEFDRLFNTDRKR